MSEPKGRGAAWTEERGACGERRGAAAAGGHADMAAPKGAPEASEQWH
jgi:hypothetical protein